MTETPLPTRDRILTPQERRRRNRKEMRDTILATALEMIDEEGAAALNLHELARRVHLRTSSLYVYFDNRMAIYDALYALGVQVYRQEVERIAQTPAGPWQLLQAVLERYMELAVQNPGLFQIVFERPIPGFEPSAASLAEADRMTAAMYRLLNRVTAVDEPEPSRNLPAAHGLIVAMMHGLTALHVANDPGRPTGSGRFGSLIPAAVELFKTVWGDPSHQSSLPVKDRHQDS